MPEDIIEEFIPEAPEVKPAPRPKAKTKAELEDEVEALQAELAELHAKFEAAKTASPGGITPKEGHKVVFIKSEWVAAITKDKKKYVQGNINGVPFEVVCNEQVEVPDDVAEVLKHVTEANKN